MENTTDWKEKVLEYIYRFQPVAYYPAPPPRTIMQEQVLQEFYDFISSKEREVYEKVRVIIKEHRDTYLEKDNGESWAYSALDDLLEKLK